MTASRATTAPIDGIGGREPLRARDDVGPDVVAVGAEPVAESPERADHLVGAKQDPVAVADLADALPVPLGSREGAACVLDGLHDHHRHRVGSGLEDRFLEILHQERRELGLRLLRRTVVAVGVPDMESLRNERLEGCLQRGDPVDRERAHGRPVVGDATPDRLPAALAASRVVLACKLPGRLDRLGAAGAEEDAVQVARRERGDLRRQLDRAWVGVAPVRVERKLAHLRRCRLPHLLAEAVADLDGEEPCQRVEIALAVRVLQVAAVATDDDRDVALHVARHAREVHPQMVARSLLQLGGGHGGQLGAHGVPFRPLRCDGAGR